MKDRLYSNPDTRNKESLNYELVLFVNVPPELQDSWNDATIEIWLIDQLTKEGLVVNESHSNEI